MAGMNGHWLIKWVLRKQMSLNGPREREETNPQSNASKESKGLMEDSLALRMRYKVNWARDAQES